MTGSSQCNSPASTNRLQHSLSGEYNSLRDSSVQMFIYIEGHKDDIFYKSICERALKSFGVKYQIKYGGGKPRSLAFYLYLESKNRLSPSFGNIKKAFFFFLDKDIDDLKGTLIASDYVNYTKYYAIENYYFLYGDLISSVSHAIGLHPTSINENSLLDNISWAHSASEEWKEWVKCCILAALHFPGCPNFGSKCSLIHKTDGSIDQGRRIIHENRMQVEASNSSLDYNQIWSDTNSLVEQMYNSGEHDQIFNGKWYCNFLCQDAERIARKHGVYKNRRWEHLEELLISQLRVSLRYDDKWANHFILPIQKIAKGITN